MHDTKQQYVWETYTGAIVFHLAVTTFDWLEICLKNKKTLQILKVDDPGSTSNFLRLNYMINSER